MTNPDLYTTNSSMKSFSMPNKIRLAIVGSRTYQPIRDVWIYVDGLSSLATIISGGAPGVDQMAAKAARDCGLTLIEHLAEWDKFGRGAGMIRNKKIVADCDRLVAFWDGKSKGTLNSIQLAINTGKFVLIIPQARHEETSCLSK